jgi:hypothetical protein
MTIIPSGSLIEKIGSPNQVRMGIGWGFGWEATTTPLKSLFFTTTQKSNQYFYCLRWVR